MKLSEQLMQDFKTYLINKNTTQKNTIQMLRAEILNKSKDLHRDLNEEEILEIIAKEIKQKQGAIDEFRKGNREDLVEQAKEEIETLNKYMPTLLTVEELTNIVLTMKEKIGATTIKDMGNLIKEVKLQVGIRANGKMISEIAKGVLI